MLKLMLLIVKHLFFSDTFFFLPAFENNYYKTSFTRFLEKGKKTDKRPNKLLFFKEYCVCLQIWYCLGGNPCLFQLVFGQKCHSLKLCTIIIFSFKLLKIVRVY